MLSCGQADPESPVLEEIMSLVSLPSMPDEARLWCFGTDRSPDGRETAHLIDSVTRFMDSWTAHGRGLTAAIDWRQQHFLFVAADERDVSASGCSIDALTDHFRKLEGELHLSLLDGTPVWYRGADGRIRTVSRIRFRRLAEERAINGNTTVFDLTLSSVGQLRAGRFEVPAQESWHARLLAPVFRVDDGARPGAARG